MASLYNVGFLLKKSFNTDYPLKKLPWVGCHQAYFMTLTPSPFQLPIEEISWLRFTYHSSIGPWGPMEVVMRASIKQFHYFRRPKGTAHTPIIRLLKLECRITLL